MTAAIRILLVEDDEDDYKLACDLLSDDADGKFEIDWAQTYDAAIAQIRSSTYDAFLVDYRLGRRSGLDLLCGELQRGRVGPVVILSGQNLSEMDAEAKKLGAAAYIEKIGLDGKTLAKALRDAIDSHDARIAERMAPAARPAKPAPPIPAPAPVSTAGAWPTDAMTSTSSMDAAPPEAPSASAQSESSAPSGWEPSFNPPPSLSRWAPAPAPPPPSSSPAPAPAPSVSAPPFAAGSFEEMSVPVPTPPTLTEAWLPSSGLVIAMMGAKGGSGTSSVVANVACSLRARGKRVLMIELRGDHGTLSRLLAFDVVSDISSLLRVDAADIDEERFLAALCAQADGVRLLAAPQSVEDYREPSSAQARAIIELAVAHFDFVLLDLPSGAGAAKREALSLSDLIVLVIEKEQSAVDAARSALALLQSWELVAPVGSVINARANVGETLTSAEINTELGLRKLGVVPSAPELFHKAVLAREAVAVAHKAHPAGRALDELGQFLRKQPATCVRSAPSAAATE